MGFHSFYHLYYYLSENRDFPKSQRFHASTFYSVAFRDTDTEIVNNPTSGITDTELTTLAVQIISDGKIYGTRQPMIYLLDETSDYTLVVFMDNTVVNDTFTLLIQYMLIFGGIAVLLLILISIFLSNIIIRPLEENLAIMCGWIILNTKITAWSQL